MKIILLIAILSFAFSAALALQSPLLHTKIAFALTLRAPMNIVAPLFGAEKERLWAGADWDPKFLYPQPANDQEGAVFTIRHGEHTATWVCTAFDLSAGHIQYVYLLPEAMAVRIDIHLTQSGPGMTLAHVVYERTALNASAEEHVRHLTQADRSAGPEWERQINDYLAQHSHR